MDATELKDVLARHVDWLRNIATGMRADLSRADLSGADLSWANLLGADLLGADLLGANLSRAKLAVSVVLRASWGALSAKLTLELMRHDAESCGMKGMNDWAKGGACPFANSERDFYFQEDKKLWKAGEPKLRGMKLLKALANEKGIKLKDK